MIFKKIKRRTHQETMIRTDWLMSLINEVDY